MTNLRRKYRLALVVVVVNLLLLEALCRVCGFPQGNFEEIFPGRRFLYPADRELTMTWGPIPYLVRANALGFRGENFTTDKTPGTLRVLTIGDSLTDGFFVDNSATWQPWLQAELNGISRGPVDVVNGARGGGSIDRELAVLRHAAPLVDPDIVVLTFVTNDIAEILGTSRARLRERSLADPTITAGQRLQKFLVTRTGLGEFLFHAYLTARSPAYRERPQGEDLRLDDSRYAIAGGEDFTANAAAFTEHFADMDGKVLGTSFTDDVETAFANYCNLLGEFASYCRERGTRLLFVYFPAYPQIYDPQAPRYINERLRAECAELEIDFLDLTAGFRGAGRERVLHLAPLDFHPNPAGNRILARLVASHLAAFVRE